MTSATATRFLAGPIMLAALAVAAPSQAQMSDADAFMQRLLEGIRAGGGEVSYGEVNVSGDRITLSDVEIEMAPAEPATMPSITFEGVAATDSGGFTVALMTIPSLTAREDGGEIDIADIAISGLEIPSGETADASADYDQALTGPVAVTVDGNEVFAAQSTTVDISQAAGGAGIESVVEASGIVIDPVLAGHPWAIETIRALGYDELTGSMHLTSTWGEAEGAVEISDLSLMLDDIGIITAAFEISGLSGDLMLALEDGETAGDDADGLAAFQMMEDVVLSSASLRFLDTGLTDRALAHAGAAQGVDGERMAAVLKVMLPLALARLDNPVLQAEIMTAADSFLEDPDTIVIEARPERPIPVLELTAAAVLMPLALPEILNISVSAPD